LIPALTIVLFLNFNGDPARSERFPERMRADIVEAVDRFQVLNRSVKNVSFAPGEEINLEISWGGLKIAEIKSSVTRKTLPGGTPVLGIDCTAEVQILFLNKSEKWLTAVNPRSLCPLEFKRIRNDPGEKIIEKLQYDPVNARAFFQREITDPGSGKITQIRRKELPASAETQNALSAFYLIRALSWEKGQSRTLPIINDKDFIEVWHCECRGREKLDRQPKDERALKLQLVTEPVDKEKRGKRALIWLSDDSAKRPLRVEVDCKIGTLVAVPAEAENGFRTD